MLLSPNKSEWSKLKMKKLGYFFYTFVPLIADEAIAAASLKENMEKHHLNTICVLHGDEFLKKNNLDRDDDVLMIMRDAVFVIVKPIQYQDIGSCHFRPKGSYSGFLRCSPYEFLVASDHIDVKGMKDEDLDLHKNGVLQMIRDVYDACSEYHMDTIKISQYLKELLVAYKEKALPLDYYREFNSTGKFKLIYDSHDIMMDSITEEDLPELSIDYNYVKIILPLIRNLI